MSQLDNAMSFDWNGTPPSKAKDNQTNFQTPLGDADPTIRNENDGPEDYAHDTSGVPADGGPSTQTDMELTLEPNKFPRQKGHDSLSEEEATLS